MERKGKLTRKVMRSPVECTQTHGNLNKFYLDVVDEYFQLCF